MDAIGEQQLKWTQQLKRDPGAAAEADANGEHKLKRTQSGTAAEADTSGEQQLKQMQTGSSS